MKKLLVDTPEVHNWILDGLSNGGMKIPSIEGYSVKNDAITALVERRISNVDVEKWSDDEIAAFLNTEKGIHWDLKTRLSSILKTPLYLIIWKNEKEKFRIFELKGQDTSFQVSTKELFESCLELATWLSSLKGIKVTKGFVESGRLSLIDQCLRKHGVPWPGNLDGFLINKDHTKINSIFEFSRTRKYPVTTHNLNSFFSQDKNRWAVFDTLKKSLNCSAFIIIWSSEEKIIKLQKLKEVNSDGLIYDSEKIIKEDEVFSKISDLVY